ncbi:MAG TPA: MmgE/PrpD family protein [Nocardioidaceae bacterium]|nr:MmgE/PrpD family protein [Nocardioidaceae bacterium]
MATSNPTRALAELVTNFPAERLPAAVREQTAIVILDTLASAMAGQDADESARVVDAAHAVYGGGDSTMLNGDTGSQAAATMVNAYLTTAVTVCDIHYPTVCHVTPEVVPPALAVAEQRGSSGAELLHAVAMGLEVTTRIGVALNYQAFRDRGFHSPGITGPFGGATSAGLLAGLDGSQLTHAYGIAASQASGTWAQLGSPTIKFQQAHGAMSGLLAATLAGRSFTATEDGLGAADGGLFSSYSDGGDPDALLADFGSRWEMLRISLRPSPAAAYLQGVVTAMLALVREHDVRPESVATIRLGLSDTGYALHGELSPKDRFQARLSARYVAAVVLHDRQCWLEQFTAQRFADDELIRFARERVTTIEDPEVKAGGATVEVRLVDGETLSMTAAVPKGDPDDPLSFDEVAEKFWMSAAGKLPAAVCEQTVAAMRELGSVGDVRSLLMPLRNGHGGHDERASGLLDGRVAGAKL